MLRGSLDPKKPPVYEYVKFIGNFKSLANSKCLVSFQFITCCFKIVCAKYTSKADDFLIIFLFPLTVPLTTRNGLEGIIQRTLQPAFDDQVCFIATVRLAKPQFIKVSG